MNLNHESLFDISRWLEPLWFGFDIIYQINSAFSSEYLQHCLRVFRWITPRHYALEIFLQLN